MIKGFRKISLSLVAMVTLGGCVTSGKATQSLILQSEDLDQGMARDRAANVKNVSYDLYLKLSKDQTSFTGDQKMIFDLREVKDVYFDFQGGELLQSVVNGHVLKLERGPVFVKIPQQYLRHERNMVILSFQHEHSRSGTGFHRFTDPEDQNVYLYTDFQPFDASKMAPFFDQPDIKATFALTVHAPSDWQVISNGRILSAKVEGDLKKWQFIRTPALSTYLYAVMAGPYIYRESSYKKKPLRIYARKSMAPYIPYEQWFKVTRQGLAYFEDFFGITYPYGKYDQIVLPELGAGAMENAGAITFTERYIKRGGMKRRDNVYFYNIVLHEMAHQWFGNLVTMKWWDDLWLNESFATFMAPLAQEKATEYKEAWQFYRTDKVAAYRQDQSSTTHPIAAPVANTNEAFTYFDDITYGKGAAVLQQLYYYLGADTFKKGIREYFRLHANQNTELKDFIAAFETASQEDLKPWFNSWLKTTGVDQLQTQFTCSEGQFQLQLKYLNADSRPQALRVALIKNQGAIPRITRVLEVKRRPQDVASAEWSVQIPMQAPECPDFVHANYGDHGYVELRYDAQMISYLEKHLAQIPEPLLRQTIWSDLWEELRDQRLSLKQFSDLALASLKTETNPEILEFLAEKTIGEGSGQLSSVYYFWPRTTPEEKAQFLALAEQYVGVFRERMLGLSPQSDLYRFFVSNWLQAQQATAKVDQIVQLLPSLTDTALRWKAIVALCSAGVSQAESFMAQELAKDKSDFAQKNSLICQAKKPDPLYKQQWVQKLVAEKMTLSADEVNSLASNLFYGSQRSAISPYTADIFSALRSRWGSLDESYQSRLAGSLAPIYCDQSAHDKLASFIKNHQELPASIKTPLLERLDDDKICLSVRAKWQGPTSL